MMTPLATQTEQWIEKACREFSEAIGWPLHFSRADPIDGLQSEAELPDAAEGCCWSTQIVDGEQPVGTLWIDLPDDLQDDRSYLTVCRLAELFGDLITRLSTASKSLDSRRRRSFASIRTSGRSASKR